MRPSCWCWLTRLGLLGRIWVPFFAKSFHSFKFFIISSNGMFSTSSFLEKPGAGKIRWYFDEVSRLGWYVILPDLTIPDVKIIACLKWCG